MEDFAFRNPSAPLRSPAPEEPQNRTHAPRTHAFAGPTVPPPANSREDLARIFNTVLVSTQLDGGRDSSAAICDLMENPAFHSILGAVRQHSRLQGVSERDASEQLIRCFRQIDKLWHDYVFQQGLDRIKNVT